MSYTIENTYVGDGTTVLYSFTFEYIEPTDIEVSLDSVITTEWTFANATTVEFNTAPGDGVNIRIYRNTTVTSPKAIFFPGSAIRAQDLNDNFEQILYVTQESDVISERAEEAAKEAEIAAEDARQAADEAEAAGEQAKADAEQANQAAQNAADSAAEAAQNAGNAQGDASEALATANEAKAESSQALIAASNAATDAASAQSSASAAESSASAAQSSASAAESSASVAQAAAESASTDATEAIQAAQIALTAANDADDKADAALLEADNALAVANAAASAVGDALLFEVVANVAAIPTSPDDGDAAEVTDSTGIESFSPLVGLPPQFIGDPGKKVNIRFTSAGSTWNYLSYAANDPDNRYAGPATGVGTKDNPSIGFKGDQNTGIFHPSEGAVAITSNGTVVSQTDASGVKIGGAVPSAPNITLASSGAITASTYNNLSIYRDTKFNIGLGADALPSVSGFYNLAWGYQSLYDLTSGSSNVGIGYKALTENITGSSNTAVGYKALTVATGSNNVALGNEAGSFIVGSSNTVLGAYKGTAADSTLNNTVIISAGPNEKLRINETGSLLFGGTLPSSPNITLKAGGQIITTADATINSVTVGRGGGDFISNTALGSNALSSDTTGENNSATGLYALSGNTEGDYNTATGSFALLKNTTGNSNTATGAYSLYNHTTGNSNTANGYYALYNNTTGRRNVAIGDNAGYFIEGDNNTILGAYKGVAGDSTLSNTVIISAGTTEKLRIDSSGSLLFGGTLSSSPNITLNADGSGAFAADATINSLTVGRGGGGIDTNTVVGNNAFKANTTGLQNVATGTNALTANLTGQKNVATGHNALGSNTGGSENVATGRLTLYSNTTGNYNNSIGSGSLFSNIGGSYNVAIGNEAGYYIGGSRNTILGPYKGSVGDATLNDTVIISAGTTERLRIDSSGAATFAGTVTADSFISTGGGGLSPTGSVTMFAGATVPDGWLECNGQTAPSALAAVLGQATVPDLRGEFVRGWDNGRGVDAGRNLLTEQGGMISNHNHDMWVSSGSGITRNGAYDHFGQVMNTTDYVQNPNNVSGATAGDETRPRNVALMYIIKT